MAFLSTDLSKNVDKMKSLSFLAAGLLALVGSAGATPIEQRAASVKGFDISNHQKSVDFNKAYKDGARFVIMKVRATIDETIWSRHHQPDSSGSGGHDLHGMCVLT